MILLDEAARATLPGAEAETAGKRGRRLKEPEPPVLELPKPDPVTETPVPRRPLRRPRRPRRGRPVRRGTHPAVWVAVVFFVLLLVGFILTFVLDRRLSG